MEVARVNTVSWTLDQLEATANDFRTIAPDLAQRIQANTSVVVIEFDALYGFVRKSISYNAWIGTSLPLDSHEVSIAMPLDDEYAIDEAYAALDAEPTKEGFASVVIPPDAFGALPASDYATAAYDVDVYKGDPKNGNLVANYTVNGFEEARAIAARFTEDGRQCVIQRFDKQPLIGEFDYWCKKIGAYPYTASDGRTYPAIRQEVTA